MPAVSVVIPCYNQGQYLAEAVASVDAQTFTDWEIIVVDDGSTAAATQEILERFNHPRARLIRSPNRGIGGARNLGISHAAGRYILPLDCDDRIAPTYLAQAVALLETRADLGIVYCRAEFFGSQSGPWLLPPFRLPDFIFEPCIFCSALFRRADWELVGGYNPALRRGYEDHDFWLALVGRGRGVHQLPEVLFHYRRTPQSMAQSLDLDAQVAAFMTMYGRHRDLFTAHLPTLFRGFLRREGLAQIHHQRPVLQVFWNDPAGHNEASSSRTEYAAGDWVQVRVAVRVFAGSPVPLRLDPGFQAGCFDLAELRWLAGGTPLGAPLPLSATTGTVAGTALGLPAAGCRRLLSFGSDPQLLLGDIVPPVGADGLELRLRFSPQLTSAADSLAALAAGQPLA